jgi:hypothetical protein
LLVAKSKSKSQSKRRELGDVWRKATRLEHFFYEHRAPATSDACQKKGLEEFLSS